MAGRPGVRPDWLNPFYPVMPDADWVERLVPRGVKLIQLRLKDANDNEIRRQIDRCQAVCARHGCQLIVNDYWRAAISAGADFVHLGQEDLAEADVAAIAAAGLKLGVSTHSHEELDIALAVKPDYVALGPIYPTSLKKMKWAPQGLEKLGDWRSRIDLPLVGIGGITVERASGVLFAGADSIAVVTDIVTHETPERRADEWVAWAEQVASARA